LRELNEPYGVIDPDARADEWLAAALEYGIRREKQAQAIDAV